MRRPRGPRARSPAQSSGRQLIYRLLGLSTDEAAHCTQLVPVATTAERATILAAEHAEWYTLDRKRANAFYWPSLVKHLGEARNLTGTALNELDRMTDLVMRNLSDPSRREAFQSKGLVVGFVQSGKTTTLPASSRRRSTLDIG